MNAWMTTLAAALIAGAPLVAQDKLAPEAFIDSVEQARANAAEARAMAEEARAMGEEARINAAEMKLKAAQDSLDFAGKAFKFDFDLQDLQGLQGLAHLKSDLAMLQQAPLPPQPAQPAQPPQGPFPGPNPKGRIIIRGNGNYDQGTRLLDEHQYDQAIMVFERQIAGRSDRADGALYWKAYALNRLGRRDEALAALATLRHDFPSSHWLNDAQVLEAEVKQNAGRPISPADETNEDIKLMAINSLMSADPDRAIPLLETLLKSGNSLRLKERALFVLTQNRSPKAEQILTDYAKGAGNPDLQLRAIRYIAQIGTPDSQQRLATIYTSSNDAGIKVEILRQLGGMKANDQLFKLYSPDSSPEIKIEIVRALRSEGASDKLLELARSEKDASVRMSIVQELASTRSTSAESLTSMYSADNDMKTKRAIINGLHSRGDAKPLIEIARKETDPAMKKYIVERLASMRNNKEATDYMLELLK